MTYLDYSFDINKWSLTFNQFKYLIFLLNIFHPNSICELGCGESTKIFNEYVKRNKGTSFLSIEHDSQYKQDNVILCKLIEHGLLDINNYHFDNVNYYEGLENVLKGYKFDLVLIDGPFSWNESYQYARIQSLLFTENRLMNSPSIMMIHDCERKNIINMLNLLNKSFENNRYLTSKSYIVDRYDKVMIKYNILEKENADS